MKKLNTLPGIISLNKTLVFIIFTLLTSCHSIRYFWWNFPDLKDYKKFPAAPVETGAEKSIFPAKNTVDFSLPVNYADVKNRDFEAFLEKHGTVAYIVLVGDTLVYEQYFHGYKHESIIPSFSVSKVFVSALAGIAIDEKKIGSVHDRITDYLGFFEEKGMDEVTIEDLLNMRSGIAFSERYSSPFADVPKYYYGRYLKKYVSRLRLKSTPEQAYDYISVNTLILGLVIEKATGQDLSSYLESRIWKPLGMESDASWSVDSRKSGTIKSFCCLNALAMDFMRFGKLYLQNGNWNGQQVIPGSWVERSISVMNDSRDSQGYPYTYHWRVDGSTGYFAKGILGQYIMIFPSKRAVVVRLGKKTGSIDWYRFTKDLLEQVNQ